MSTCAHGPSPANSLQELGGEPGAGLAQVGRVLHVGEVRVDVAPVARVQRQAPGVVAARPPPPSTIRVAPVVVVREEAGVEVAERDLHRARSAWRGRPRASRPRCGRTRARRRGRAGPRRRCSTISIVLPFGARDDVAGPVRVAAGHVLGGGDHGEHAQRAGRARRSRRSPRSPRAPPPMSPFMSSMWSGGFSEMPPVSNVIRLADEPEHEVRRAASGRVVAQHDQARLVVASRADRGERAHAERARSRPARAPRR